MNLFSRDDIRSTMLWEGQEIVEYDTGVVMEIGYFLIYLRKAADNIDLKKTLFSPRCFKL